MESIAPGAETAEALQEARPQTLAPNSIAGALCAALLGLFLIYLSGLSQVGEIHNGAHDSRHSAGFPCH